jgi:hypothetical protein
MILRIPSTLNRYTFGIDDPINFTDKKGSELDDGDLAELWPIDFGGEVGGGGGFSGLTIGRATIAALRQVFGKPVDMNQDNSDTTWLHYRNIGPVPGTVEIQADSKSQVIQVISIVPDNLTVQAAETLYGRDFRVIRYAFDNCLDVGGDSPIYESPTGSLEFIVYPTLGIAIRQERGRVIEIEYRSDSLGPKESQCKGKPGK